MSIKPIKGKIENLPSDGEHSMEVLVNHLMQFKGWEKVSSFCIADDVGNPGRFVKFLHKDTVYWVKVVDRNTYLEYSIGITQKTKKDYDKSCFRKGLDFVCKALSLSKIASEFFQDAILDRIENIIKECFKE